MSTTTITIPGTDYESVWHITIPTESVETVRALAYRIPYGPAHDRGILEYLVAAARATYKGELDTAQRRIADAVEREHRITSNI